MAPVYLNPPLDSDPYFQIAQQKDDQLLQKLIRFSNPASDSLSSPTFLHSIHEQRMINLLGESQLHGQKVGQRIANGCSSDLQISIQANKNKKMNNISNNKLPIRKREVGEGSSTSDDVSSSSAKWMSSKMRLMHKMINSSNNNSTTTANDESVKVSQKLQNQMHDDGEVDSFSNSSSNNTIRVCSDCNTTTTPLWRSGPRGPKSLCNACGIRKRKARRAMEAAAAAAAAAGNCTVAGTNDSTFTKIKLQIKDKKQRTSHVGQYKKHCKIPESDQSQRKICFKDFALSLSNNSALKQVFPQDVEEAAILLMELSCGFIHT